MNAAAEVLRLRHWPPRGVYTRWRPRKRFAPASCVYHQHLQESYPLSTPPSVQNCTFVRLFFVIFHTSTLPFAPVRPSEPASSKTGFLPPTMPSTATWQHQ